ncbi:MAG: polysaccharide deacetylase family protein [Candidatus Eisenbacteria bacterium]|uniref:Polysaccharide deacetylase family protein n=1 Tax=Eiseniibacteriota bacterium TaxID=2212470 RepID=A0A948RV22_UNCEI|nr:polysaccharide deacetylase family protein [Candidatus Eisenbacteria bacterium]MBU1948554.1 polysaccharide deacetylase family protein [Candidatus Eisenbacteria bacterium]MBU2691056.1 polysaccharide deacetylase family protein [Candidatus Eisenbacteria bacterium]
MPSPLGTRRVTRPRITRSQVLLAGLLMAFLAVIATIGLLRIYPPGPMQPSLKPAESPAASEIENLEIVILSTEANHSYFKSFGGDETIILQPWQDLFRKLGIRNRLIPSLDDWQGEVLLLPHAFCLSDQECLQIEQGIEDGEGVIFAGAAGVRNPNGSWRGWDRMKSLLGCTEIREFELQETSFIYISPDGPIGTRSLSGYRIALDKRPSQWGITGLPSAAVWSNWMREPNPYSSKPFSAAAVGVKGAGRIAWVGFDPDLPTAQADNIKTSLTFLREMILWCSGTPVSEPDLWPGGKKMALLVVTDTEHEFANARHIDTVLTFYGIRGGFMCLSDLAKKYPDIVESLAERHDIGSHSDDHQRFDGQPFKQQIERLHRSSKDLSRIIGRPILGFRPPQEGFDQATIKAMAQTGFQYLLGSGNIASAMPEILPAPTAENPNAFVITIPRAQRDDYQLLEKEDGTEIGVLKKLRFDFEKTRCFNGIDYVSLHTQVMGKTENIEDLEQFLASIPLEELWISGPDGLAKWWIQRHGVKTSIRRGNDEFALFIENGASDVVEGLCVWVCLPGNPDHLQVEGEIKNLQGPDPRGAYRIDCGTIQSREMRIIRLKSGSGDWASMTELP